MDSQINGFFNVIKLQCVFKYVFKYLGNYLGFPSPQNSNFQFIIPTFPMVIFFLKVVFLSGILQPAGLCFSLLHPTQSTLLTVSTLM